jgi:hypothetical protein
LTGRRGVGKRTAGLHLIDELTGGRATIVLLSPAYTLPELSSRTYDKGFGYLVLDREDESHTAEADFAWRTIRDSVKEAGAYMLVSTTKARTRTDSVRQVEWCQPDRRRLFRAHLAESGIDDVVIERILGAVEECPMADLVDIARRVAAGEDDRTVLSSYEAAVAADVRAWFDRRPERREVLAVTVLAFVGEGTKRTFDELLRRLEATMAEHVSPPKPSRAKQKGPDVLAEGMGSLIGSASLMDLERRTSGGTAAQVPTFRKAGYRRQVIIELCSRYDAPFWDAVREWIVSVVENDHGVPAWGLALLAGIDFDDVEVTYLDPWSRGQVGWPGQVAAAHVLWSMCFDDATAPVALRMAKEWATQGDAAQRWTASTAFSGWLGVCYPTEAVRRLWQLAVQSAAGNESACAALAVLFANLVGSDTDAGIVINLVSHRLARYLERGDKPQLVGVAMLAGLMILTIRDPESGQPSIFSYINKYPDRVDVVTQLWARVLPHSMYRRRAMIALLDGLASLRKTTEDPTGTAGALGAAFARALSPEEQEQFREDLTYTEATRRDRRPANGSLARTLIEAFDEYLRNRDPEDGE